MIPQLLTLPGERDEYEWVMLAHACRFNQPPVEALIESEFQESSRSARVLSAGGFLRSCLALFRLRRFR
jgi:hypothetical protein